MKMRELVRSCVWIILAGVMVFPLRAEEPPQAPTVDVVASGVGKDETEATKDALANAVRQAIGAIVGVETMVQNEEVVRDQILTYSDGFVEKYEVVGKPGTTLSGLTSITIRARIVHDKLVQKAKAANISILEVDGKSMFAEVTSKIEQQKSATAMIAEEFRDMPRRLIKAEVIGKPNYDNKMGRVHVTIRTSIDRRAYDAFVDRLSRLLDGIGVESFSLASSDVGIDNRYVDKEIREKFVFSINFPESLFPETYLRQMNSRDLSSIVLCVRANDNLSSSQWKVYLVDQSIVTQVNAMLNPVTVSVDVVGSNHEVMDSHFVVIGTVDSSNQHLLDGPVSFEEVGYQQAGNQLVVYPGLVGAPKLAHWGHVSLCLGPVRMNSSIGFDMSPEKLKDITQIACRVESARGAR